jgi:inner membrane protein
LDYFKTGKNRIDFLQASYMVLVSVYPCITGYVYLLGTQILWPLDYRFALKTIFVVDPLYTIPLVIALIWYGKQKMLHFAKKHNQRPIH